jgi:hypothetical protein
MSKFSQVTTTLTSFMPISRFHEGDNTKIFEDVKSTGCKIIFENNIPAYVLMSYQETMDLAFPDGAPAGFTPTPVNEIKPKQPDLMNQVKEEAKAAAEPPKPEVKPEPPKPPEPPAPKPPEPPKPSQNSGRPNQQQRMQQQQQMNQPKPPAPTQPAKPAAPAPVKPPPPAPKPPEPPKKELTEDEKLMEALNDFQAFLEPDDDSDDGELTMTL